MSDINPQAIGAAWGETNTFLQRLNASLEKASSDSTRLAASLTRATWTLAVVAAIQIALQAIILWGS